jgi:hypothetical protein
VARCCERAAATPEGGKRTPSSSTNQARKHAGIAAIGQQEPPRNRVLAFLGPFLSAVTLARSGSKIQAGLPLLGSLCRRARLAPRVALFLSLVPEHPRRVMASVPVP